MWWVTLVALVLCLAGQVRLVFKHRDGWILNSLGAMVFMIFFIIKLHQLFSLENFILLLANVMFLTFMPHMQLVLEVPRDKDVPVRRCFLSLDTKSENYKALVENLKKQIIQYNTQRDFIWKKLQAFGQHLKEVE